MPWCEARRVWCACRKASSCVDSGVLVVVVVGRAGMESSGCCRDCWNWDWDCEGGGWLSLSEDMRR